MAWATALSRSIEITEYFRSSLSSSQASGCYGSLRGDVMLEAPACWDNALFGTPEMNSQDLVDSPRNGCLSVPREKHVVNGMPLYPE